MTENNVLPRNMRMEVYSWLTAPDFFKITCMSKKEAEYIKEYQFMFNFDIFIELGAQT